MKKNKLVKLNLFDENLNEADLESWQIEITAPVGASITIVTEKASAEKRTVPADAKSVTHQIETLPATLETADVTVANQTEAIASLPEKTKNTKRIAVWAESIFTQLRKQVKVKSIAAWFESTPDSPGETTNTNSVKAWFKSPENIIFLACIAIYLSVRLIGLTAYPVYFTFDEAIPAIFASDFLRDGFREHGGQLFPAFFPNPGGNYNLGSTGIYIHLVTLLLFGRSDYAIRATSVVIGLIGAICVSLALRDIFRIRYWWAGILILSVLPAWFHMSRTEYGVPTFVACYAAMLYCYWVYRFRNPNYLYPAIIFASLAFYEYAPGQALIPLTILALFVLDFPYHWRTRITVMRGAMLGLLCVLPYIRFQITHSNNTTFVLNNVGSYWIQDLPLTEKITQFLQRYFFHLSPVYWFTPAYDETATDSLLYIMKGYGLLGLWLIPLLAWGLWLLVRRLRQPEYRALLAVLLIAPVGAALVTSPSSITRALVMVVSVTIIASIGLDDLLRKVASRFHPNKSKLFAIALLTVLLAVNSYMMWDVLTNGISWFDNNQAGGVQFGASKVFPILKEEMKANPNTHAVISPEWSMLTDLVARVYLGDNANISFTSIYDLARTQGKINEDMIFVVTPQEFEFAQKDPKFSDIEILKTIPYSKSKVGFYIIKLNYSPEAEAIWAAEDMERRKLLSGEIVIDGEPVKINHTRNDGTLIEGAFDDDPVSLYKSLRVNPVFFDLTFPQERDFQSVYIFHGSAPIELQVTFFSAAGDELKSYTTEFEGNGEQGHTLNFDEKVKASRVTIEVKVLHTDDSATVHIWEIAFNK